MNKGIGIIGTAGLGAGLMFLMDPAQGNRRRSLLKDKMTHYLSEAGDFLGSKCRHLTNIATGRMKQMQAHVAPEEQPTA
jgi:hypothetical protein